MSQPQDAVTTALNRFGLGARADLTDALRRAISGDPRGWLKSQIDPAKAVIAYTDLPDTKTNLLNDIAYQRMKKAQRDVASGMSYPGLANPVAASLPMSPTGLTGAVTAMGNPKDPNPSRDVLMAESVARATKAFDDPSGFAERMVWFWSNHFAVSTAKAQQVAVTAGSYEREAIRPYVFGRFADMLKAVEQHPAMQFFLDNRDSIGPNSKAAVNNKDPNKKGLNENLAREILELHTMGVGSGYTQADVTSFAKIITGWGWAGPDAKNVEPCVFNFFPYRHEPGPQVVLGKTYAQEDVGQGEAVLSDLSRNPATAKHIATKLARHFVADDPPPSLVDKLAKTFLDSDGDLKAVTTELVSADESWQGPAQKFRGPQEFVLAAARAFNLPPSADRPYLNLFRDLGQPLWRPGGPNGFGDRRQDWASPEGLKVRLAYAAQLAKQTQVADNPSDLASRIFGTAVSTDTREAIARAESKQQGLALLLMSPEFQYR